MQTSKLRSPSCFLFGLLFVFVSLSLNAAAQTTAPNEWTWVGGSDNLSCPNGSICGAAATYGTLQSPGAGNIPGGRYSPATWTDSTGNLWLFGGWGVDSAGHYVPLNDLWEYFPSTNQWEWMGGNKIEVWGQKGVYGTLGTPAIGNIPGGRSGASSWTDSKGNLWLFGGVAYDGSITFYGLNDLWEFNPATNEWAWMGGSSTVGCAEYVCSNPGVYGSLGIPATGNIPGSRSNASTWTDKNGNFWLFGGDGFNDLWEFNPTLGPYGEWTWMSGSNTASQVGVYGTLGTPSAGNVPGDRASASSWTDQSGNLWLFGGSIVNAAGGLSYFNDLWEFNPSLGSNGQWAWISGSSDGNEAAVYGTLGTPSAGSVPGGRYGAESWTDSSGNFWLFGGYSYNGNGGAGWLDDLWEFRPSSNEWTWMGGNSTPGQPGVYGTLGTPSARNIPGGRSSASSWADSKGNFWLFGGEGEIEGGYSYGFLNDFWVYQASSTPSFPTTAKPVISPGTGTYTTFEPVTITDSDSASGAVIYYTTDGSTPTASSTQYTGGITVSTSETIQAIAIAANYLNSNVASATYTLNLPTVATPTFPLAPGTYSASQSVTITDSTPGAAIYYTTNGSTPTTSSTQYTGSLSLSGAVTINAIAVATNYSNSAVTSTTYNFTPDFSVPSTLPPVTVATGTSWNEMIAVKPFGGFTGTVYFSCSGLPTEATCSFLPNTITGSGSTQITVTAVAPNTASLRRDRFPVLPASALAALICCFGLKKRRRLQMLMLLVVSVAGLSLVTSCGGGGGQTIVKQTYTPLPNTETITVTATSGSLSHTTTFTLTVND